MNAAAKKPAYEATRRLGDALEMVADFQAFVGCWTAFSLYRESVGTFKTSLHYAVVQGMNLQYCQCKGDDQRCDIPHARDVWGDLGFSFFLSETSQLSKVLLRSCVNVSIFFP